MMSLRNVLTHLLNRRQLRERTARDAPGRPCVPGTRAIGAAGLPEHWQATAGEIAADYPCDGLGKSDVRALTRAVDVDAPASVTFRWLCQLRVAPYSYDWIDNAGRTSPRVLTPGLDRLLPGQGFGVGTLACFARDEHITIKALPAAERWFGLVAMTYRVTARSPATGRLVVRLLVREPTRLWQRLRFHLLVWGDLIMMRKQLLTLKRLAEHTAREAANPTSSRSQV
jgi:hypothetical protein